jgi:hypothetical protein
MMRSAYERGCDVATLPTASPQPSQAEHDNAIENDYPMFSRPMSSKESLDELGGAASEDTSRGY